MCTYHGVAKEVEPKILALNEAEGRLAAAERERAEAERRAAEVQATLDAAKARFEAALADKVQARGRRLQHPEEGRRRRVAAERLGRERKGAGSSRPRRARERSRG